MPHTMNVEEGDAMTSLIRLFLTTACALASAGEFEAFKAYLLLVGKVLSANEAVLTVGTPTDKPQ